MTEEQWLTSTDSHGMCLFIRHATIPFRTRWQGPVEVKRFPISDRKWRLLDIACLQSVARDIDWPWLSQALERSARDADQQDFQVSKAQPLGEFIGVLLGGALSWNQSSHPLVAESLFRALASLVVGGIGTGALCGMLAHTRGSAEEVLKEQVRQVELVRDILGNPFHPEKVDPLWLRVNDAAVLHLAQTINASGNYADLPILADALEDAGCRREAILEHCRRGGLHTRGCWVVDLVLGKG